MGDREDILNEIAQTVGVDVVGPTRDDPDHIQPDFDAGTGEQVRGRGGTSQQYHLKDVADEAGVGLDTVRQFVDLRKQGHSTVSAASEMDMEMGNAIDINNAMLDMGIDPEQAQEDFNEWVETGQVPFDMSARGQQQKSGGMGMGMGGNGGGMGMGMGMGGSPSQTPNQNRNQSPNRSSGSTSQGRIDELVDRVAEAEIRGPSDIASIGQVFTELSQIAENSKSALKIGQILHGMMVEQIKQTVSEATSHRLSLQESSQAPTLEERAGGSVPERFKSKVKGMDGMGYGGHVSPELKQLVNDLKEKMKRGDREAYEKLRWIFSKSDNRDIERMLGRALDSYERKHESFDILTTELKERQRSRSSVTRPTTRKEVEDQVEGQSIDEGVIHEQVELIEQRLDEMLDHLFKNIPNDAREVAKEYGLAFQSLVPDAEDKTASQKGETGRFLVSFPDEPRGDETTAVIRGENNLDEELYVKVHVGADAEMDIGKAQEPPSEEVDPSYLGLYFPSKNSRVVMRLFPHNWTGNLSLVMQHVLKLIQWEEYHYTELQDEADTYLSELM